MGVSVKPNWKRTQPFSIKASGTLRKPDPRIAHALEGWLNATREQAPHTAVASFMRSVFGAAEADGNPSLSINAMVPEPASSPVRTAVTSLPGAARGSFAAVGSVTCSVL